ncbi:hypothetical protein OG320_30030 [Microbispora sp. NBC_01189]|uniref:hypothetical protein n=1 Tax=unclassified Microbispora TaxID=2614687 RepID=UPI002E159349|nr:hypothetical protein OG320_30030 [Microbispora sp. NBC_01189]
MTFTSARRHRARRPLLAALLLGLTLPLAACGESDSTEPAAAPTTASSTELPPTATADTATDAPATDAATDAPADADVKEIDVTISGRKVTPPPGRIEVDKGQRVRITVTGDAADEAHLHGYDKEAELKPGTPAVIEFTADQTGLFEMETHGSGLQLFQLVVR